MRLDQWLWAVRIFKTRSNAAEAIKGGHVQINGLPCKPAREVNPGKPSWLAWVKLCGLCV